MGAMPERERGFAVPESWAELRSGLGRARLPERDFPRAEFVDQVAQQDPAPTEEPVAVVVEAAPHPTRADRLLVRVGLRTPEASVDEREPVHLVALVNVGHTMRSVPTRAYPMLQDALPDSLDQAGWYPKVDRLALARAAVAELVGELPPRSVIALASFDRGANVSLQPTRVDKVEKVDEAIAALRPGLEGSDRGIEVVDQLMARMRSFCGETRVVVFSDGPTGLGGDPEEALARVAKEASRGVTYSTFAVATGMRRVPQLEQLAWVGYGKHHYVHTLGDAMSAFRTDLAEPGWIARDVQLDVQFATDTVSAVTPLGEAGASWRFDGLGRGVQHTGVYEVVLADGVDAEELVEVRWRASSPVEGEWTTSGSVSVSRNELPASFGDGDKGLQMAWISGAFADALSGRAAPPLTELLERARHAVRAEVRGDVELAALLDRAVRAEGS